MVRKNTEKYRVVTQLAEKEKEKLEILAWKSGRSVAGYLRHLVLHDIEDNYDDKD